MTGKLKQLAELDLIGDQFSNDYLTVFGAAAAKAGGVLDKLGAAGEFVDDVSQKIFGTKDLTEFNAKRRNFRNNVDQFFQQYRIEVTGAQAAIKELEMLRNIVLNPDLGPTAFKEVWQDFVAKAEEGLRQHQQFLREGIPVGPQPSILRSLEPGESQLMEIDGIQIEVTRD